MAAAGRQTVLCLVSWLLWQGRQDQRLLVRLPLHKRSAVLLASFLPALTVRERPCCGPAGAWCCTCSNMCCYWLLTTRSKPINKSSPVVCCILCYRWDLVPTQSPLSMAPSIRAMYRSPRVLRGALKWNSLPMRYCSIHTGAPAVLRVVPATAPVVDSMLCML